MTLAERLVAIQAEYDSACAEATYLKRLAASKARRVTATPMGPDEDPASEEIARLRDQADAISERASELKLQIEEIEKHFLESGETPDEGAARQFRQLQDRLARLHQRGNEAASAHAAAEGVEDELNLLRREYLRTRAAELATTYLNLAHQLIDAASQINALGSIAEQESGSPLLHLDALELPLPRDHSAGLELEVGPLRVDEQRVAQMQKTLRAQLSTLLNG
jgi:chromosome segregation ATPase